jgi:hypothetical protein
MEGALGAPILLAGLHRGARVQARGRRCSRANTPACRGAQWSAHGGSSAAPGEPVWPAWLPLSGEELVDTYLVVWSSSKTHPLFFEFWVRYLSEQKIQNASFL